MSRGSPYKVKSSSSVMDLKFAPSETPMITQSTNRRISDIFSNPEQESPSQIPTTNSTSTTTAQSPCLSEQRAKLEAIRAENGRLENERQSYHRQIASLKLCLTILHGQGMETKKALKQERALLLTEKAALRTAL